MFLQSSFSYHSVNAVSIAPTVPTHYSSSFPIFLLSLPLTPVPLFIPLPSPPLPSSGHTPLLCRQGETAKAADEQGEQRETR